MNPFSLAAGLISSENFRRHGVPDAGARLADLAKFRVYIKHRADYEKCRAVCERRFGRVAALLVVPRLLVC